MAARLRVGVNWCAVIIQLAGNPNCGNCGNYGKTIDFESY